MLVGKVFFFFGGQFFPQFDNSHKCPCKNPHPEQRVKMRKGFRSSEMFLFERYIKIEGRDEIISIDKIRGQHSRVSRNEISCIDIYLFHWNREADSYVGKKRKFGRRHFIAILLWSRACATKGY